MDEALGPDADADDDHEGSQGREHVGAKGLLPDQTAGDTSDGAIGARRGWARNGCTEQGEQAGVADSTIHGEGPSSLVPGALRAASGSRLSEASIVPGEQAGLCASEGSTSGTPGAPRSRTDIYTRRKCHVS